jgi:DNA mismatch repair protein MutS2
LWDLPSEGGAFIATAFRTHKPAAGHSTEAMIDVDTTTLEALGFPAVRDALATRGQTSRGKELAVALAPLADEAAVRLALARVEQARALLREALVIPVGGADDVRGPVARAAKGAVLSPVELLACGRLLSASSDVRAFLRARKDPMPELAQLAEGLSEGRALVSRLEYALDPAGTVKDDASDALASYRRRARKLHQDMRSRLDEMLNDASFGSYLKDKYFSVRNDRYVVPVNASFRAKVPGIVHNASQTGLTIFIEPDELIGAGNELAISEALALEEEQRILAELSELVGESAPEMTRAVEQLGAIDLVQAAARLAVDLDASAAEPRPPDAAFELVGLRHPLLVLQGKRVVPNTVRLRDAERALVISGPNAGGKTVTLSALGLVSLMTRCGLMIPAASGSSVPLFAGVLGAIGDAQDLARDLSTFSAHVTALRDVLVRSGAGWLVLVDEIAADTDPREGAALACAILERLVQGGARVVVTTHLDEVKALGLTDERFASARMGLDPERLSPTYELELGAVGASSAIDVAARVGLPDDVLAQARRLLKEGGALAQALTRIEQRERELTQTRQELTAELEASRRLSAELEVERAAAVASARQVEQRVRDELRTELDRRRDEVSRLVAELQAKPSMAEAQRAQQRIEQLAAEQRAVNERLAAHDETAQPPSTGALVAGARVKLLSLGREAKVIAVHGNSATVEVGSLRSRVKVDDLVVLGPGAAKPKPLVRAPSPARAAPAALSHPDARCDVRGLRADEAMRDIEHFLDRAFRDGPSVVVLVHGHGTGVLKEMIREALEKSPYVERFRPGDRHEGGDGVTVVDLQHS